MNRLIIVLVLAFSSSCVDPTFEEIKHDGIILYMAPPDNCDDFVLQVQDQLYFPKQLPDSFKEDSLLVEVQLSKTDDYHNCGFGGSIPVAEIITIKEKNKAG